MNYFDAWLKINIWSNRVQAVIWTLGAVLLSLLLFAPGLDTYTIELPLVRWVFTSVLLLVLMVDVVLAWNKAITRLFLDRIALKDVEMVKWRSIQRSRA